MMIYDHNLISLPFPIIEVVTVHVPLTNQLSEMNKGVQKMQPSGGGDYPEAVTGNDVVVIHSSFIIHKRVDPIIAHSLSPRFYR